MTIKITKKTENIWFWSVVSIFIILMGLAFYSISQGFILSTIIYAGCGFLFFKINFHLRKTFLDFEIIGQETKPIQFEIIDDSKLYKKEDFANWTNNIIKTK